MEIVSRRLACDIEGEQVDADAGTLRFGIDDDEYEIDLCQKNATRLRAWAAEFIPYARKVQDGAKRQPPRKETAKSNGNGLDKLQSLAVRNWARRNGKPMADRGPIPAHVLQAFEEAGGLSLLKELEDSR